MTEAQRLLDFDTRIARVIQETPRDRSFVLPIPEGDQADFRFIPGQFVVVTDPQAAQPRRKAYSISSAPQCREHVEVTVRDMGSFGHAFYDFPAGKLLHVEGPRGRFVLDDSDLDLVLVAGGSGVTPFRSFLLHLAATPGVRRTLLLQSARRADDLIFEQQFRRLATADARFTYRPTVTRPEAGDAWQGKTGRITAADVQGWMQDAARTQWYACGPGPFVKASLEMADTLGIPPARRHKEQW